MWVTRDDGTIDLDDESKTWLNEMIAARNAARKAKNFAEADRIRDELREMSIQLKDSRDPETGEITTTWEIAR
jgi:cysteinyl-tRNA synthetase